MFYLNNLSEDILVKILKDVIIDNPPLMTYCLKYLCKDFFNIINNNELEICQNKCDKDLMNKLYKNGNIMVYNWLYQNNIKLKNIDVIYLIKNNRLDVLEESLKYKINTNVLFNRFYLTNIDEVINKNFTIFDLVKTNASFLLYSTECGYLDICKFFIDNPKYPMYRKQIPKMLDISCENDKLDITKYILNNHIEFISIKRLYTCLDIFGGDIHDYIDIDILSQYNNN
jgi:hypothetical protein